MNTYWLSFKASGKWLPFTDYSEGKNLREAVERLGMKMSDLIESKKLHDKNSRIK